MYKVIETKIISEGEKTVTYGLQHTDGTAIEDVSLNRAEAERLAEYFTQQNVKSADLVNTLRVMIDREQGLEI